MGVPAGSVWQTAHASPTLCATMLPTLQVLAVLSTLLLAQAPAPGVTFANTEQRTITSTAIGQQYDLLVSLPEGYATSGKVYPVLYVLDGWHFPLMAFLQNNNRFSERMPPVIIVNISHGDDATRLRVRDFNPTRIEGQNGSEGGPAFLAFLEGDIIPLVERTYRTIPTDRAILGHSLGGLFALYAMVQRPALFQRIVAASPARLNNNREVLAAFDRLKASGAKVRLDISKGDEEPGTEALQEFVKALEGARLANVEMRYTIYPGENHNSVRLASFPAGLYWIYGPKAGR